MGHPREQQEGRRGGSGDRHYASGDKRRKNSRDRSKDDRSGRRSGSSRSSSSNNFEIRVGRKYRLGKKVGSGSFGDIYLGKHIETGKEVAIKLEPSSTRHPQLKYESRLYNLLVGAEGIPEVKWYGQEGDYNVMVMDLLGPSLEDLFCYCNRLFSVKTVCLLGIQLVSRLEFLHEKNYLHRDIKPDNFLVGLRSGGSSVGSSRSRTAGPGGSAATVYMIDFGLAKRYRDSRHNHISYRDRKSLTGTARYASINTHLGLEQSRRDDLESTGYVLMYFLRGSLPWQGLRAPNKKIKYQKICAKKMGTPVHTLCSKFPVEFSMYLSYCRSLRFDEKPNYAYLRSLFQRVAAKEKFDFDYVFDWTERKKQQRLEKEKKMLRSSNQAKAGAETVEAAKDGDTTLKADPEKRSKDDVDAEGQQAKGGGDPNGKGTETGEGEAEAALQTKKKNVDESLVESPPVAQGNKMVAFQVPTISKAEVPTRQNAYEQKQSSMKTEETNVDAGVNGAEGKQAETAGVEERPEHENQNAGKDEELELGRPPLLPRKLSISRHDEAIEAAAKMAAGGKEPQRKGQVLSSAGAAGAPSQGSL